MPALNPIILPDSNTATGCFFIDHFKFRKGMTVPIYGISSENAFNQLIGYAKFLNRDYGNVYYRGINNLYDNVLPALMRERKKGEGYDIKNIISKISSHEILKDSLKLIPLIKCKGTDYKTHCLNNRINRNNKYRIEALLQHYSGHTRFIDVVDNHWIALWMGLHDFLSCGESNQHIICRKRIINSIEIAEELHDNVNNNYSLIFSNLYEYIILIAMPYGESRPVMGVNETDEFVEVDLRKALPSFYLRPHAQHALVVRRRDNVTERVEASYYDMASQVVGILRIRTDIANKWLGNGTLVTRENLFPSPAFDNGYNNLLKNSLFEQTFEIKKYF